LDRGLAQTDRVPFTHLGKLDDFPGHDFGCGIVPVDEPQRAQRLFEGVTDDLEASEWQSVEPLQEGPTSLQLEELALRQSAVPRPPLSLLIRIAGRSAFRLSGGALAVVNGIRSLLLGHDKIRPWLETISRRFCLQIV
jgi:hypothetical protein